MRILTLCAVCTVVFSLTDTSSDNARFSRFNAKLGDNQMNLLLWRLLSWYHGRPLTVRQGASLCDYNIGQCLYAVCRACIGSVGASRTRNANTSFYFYYSLTARWATTTTLMKRSHRASECVMISSWASPPRLRQSLDRGLAHLHIHDGFKGAQTVRPNRAPQISQDPHFHIILEDGTC